MPSCSHMMCSTTMACRSISQHVERVRLAADARRGRGAGLYDDRPSPAHVVALGGRSGKGDVQMTGQKHVDPFAGELLHGFGTRPGASERCAGVRLVEWMVRDEDGNRGSIRVLQQPANPPQFAPPYPATADGEGPRGIGPDDDQLVVHVVRLEIVSHVTPIPAQRVEEAGEYVVQRHVVIARHNQMWPRQRVEKCARLAELPRPRPLGEIARHGDQVGRDRLDRVTDDVDDDRIDAAEMEVREMNEGAHYGTITCRARGRMQNASGLLSVTTSPSIDA